MNAAAGYTESGRLGRRPDELTCHGEESSGTGSAVSVGRERKDVRKKERKGPRKST